jgi:hypothetical protein
MSFYFSATCGVPLLGRPSPVGSGRSTFCRCLRKSASAGVPTHSFKFREIPGFVPETGLRPWVPSFQIKVRQKRYKRYKSPSRVPASRSFLDNGRSAPNFDRRISTGRTLPCLRPELVSYTYLSPASSKTNGTITLPTRYGLANVPFVIQRPCHLAWEGLRPVSGGAVFSKLSKLLNQEDALSAPRLKHFRNYSGPIRVARCGFPWEKTTKRPVASVCINCETAYAVISALHRRPRGAHECCGQACFDVTLPFAITESSRRQALMLSWWLAADARVERAGARPSRAVVARRR